MSTRGLPTSFEIYNEGSFQFALLQVKQLASAHGMNDIKASKLVTATSELARNILKYACRGRLDIKTIHSGYCAGIEVTAVDHGPGIQNIELAMTDKYSSSGTLGQGLPGAKRLCDEFSIVSQLGEGVIVKVVVWM